MIAPIPCPEIDDFRKFLMGGASDEDVQRLRGHLLECGRCRIKLKALEELGTPRIPQGLGPILPAWTDKAGEQVLRRLGDQRTHSIPSAEDTLERIGEPDHSTQHSTLAHCRAVIDPPKAAEELGWLGPYRLLDTIGQGGMGTVFKAEDPRLGRLVAIKVPHSSTLHAAESTARQRFLREARVAAPIRHPHVCPIYDVGEHEGSPYVVMAHVEGGSLAELLATPGQKLDCDAAAELARQVASGLAALHEHSVIHRDLKPANILIDCAGKAVLTDFGLARPDDDSEHLTDEGEIMGTVSYMAPEQAVDADNVGPPADIYSLGVVLYRMLTGRLPFRGRKLQVLAQIATETPPPPSTFRLDLDPKLERIVQKAMARNPENRFSSAAAMAEVLESWLKSVNLKSKRGIPASIANATKITFSKPPSTASSRPSPTQLGRPLRMALAVTAGIFLIVSGIYLLRIVTNGEKPAMFEASPDAAQLPGAASLMPALPARGAALNATTLVPRPMPIDGVQAWTLELPLRYGPIKALAYSPDGKLLAVAAEKGKVHLWDVGARQPAGILLGGDTSFKQLAWSPDGKHLAAVEVWVRQQVWIWEMPSRKRLATSTLKDATTLAWSPEGGTLAIGHQDGVVTWWRPNPDDLLIPLRSSPRGSDAIRALAWSPDGKSLAACARNSWWLWDVNTGVASKPRDWSADAVQALAWSPGAGTYLAVGSADKTIHVWERDLDTMLPEFVQHQKEIATLAWSQDGKRLASFDRLEAVIWSVESAESQRRLECKAESIACSPADDFLALGLENGAVDLVKSDSVKPADALPCQVTAFRVHTIAWSPDGAYLASGGPDSGIIHVWDGKTGKAMKPLVHGLQRVWALAWAPDGKTLAASSCMQGNHEVEIWDAPNAGRLRTFPSGAGPAPALAWSPVGKRLAIGGRELTVYEYESGKPLQFTGVTGNVQALAWSPDGQRLASGDQEKTVRIWDVGLTTANFFRIETMSARVTGLSWSGEGDLLAIAVERQPVCVLEVKPDGKLREIRDLAAKKLAFSSNGMLLTERGFLWQAHCNKTLQAFDGGDCVAWHPTGKIAAIGGWNRMIRLWDVEKGQLNATLMTLGGAGSIAVSADGNYRGATGIEKNLYVLVDSERGKELFTVEEFSSKYQWKNAPERVCLTGK